MSRRRWAVAAACVALWATSPSAQSVQGTLAWDVDAGGLPDVSAQYERDGVVAPCASYASPTTLTRHCRASLPPGPATFRVRMASATGEVGPWSSPVVAVVGRPGSFVTFSHHAGATPVAFPVTPVLDNFNRANEGPPLSANWTADPMNVALAGHAVVSNAAANGSHSYWDASTFGPDQEAWMTVSSLSGTLVGLYMRIQAPNTAGADAYELQWKTDGEINAIRVINAYAGETVLGTATVAPVATGYRFGARVLGSGATVTIEAYIDTGSGWTLALSTTDTDASRITAAGFVGFLSDTADVIDDFGGGTVVDADDDAKAFARGAGRGFSRGLP